MAQLWNCPWSSRLALRVRVIWGLVSFPFLSAFAVYNSPALSNVAEEFHSSSPDWKEELEMKLVYRLSSSFVFPVSHRDLLLPCWRQGVKKSIWKSCLYLYTKPYILELTFCIWVLLVLTWLTGKLDDSRHQVTTLQGPSKAQVQLDWFRLLLLLSIILLSRSMHMLFYTVKCLAIYLISM